jgi:hypothetical protein
MGLRSKLASPVPAYTVLCLIVALVGLTLFHIGEAQDNFVLTKPYVTTITIVTSPLRLYNLAPANNQWTQMAVTVINMGSVDANGTVTLEFYDVNNIRIGQGTYVIQTPIPPSGTLSFAVTISWNVGKSYSDATNGKVTVG